MDKTTRSNFSGKKSEREFNPPSLLAFEMLVLLRDLDRPAEEGVLIGRVLAVPLDNRVDRFEILEIKRLHSEEIIGQWSCLFRFWGELLGLSPLEVGGGAPSEASHPKTNPTLQKIRSANGHCCALPGRLAGIEM